MKKKIISITVCLAIIAGIGVVLANNKSKIDKAAQPTKDKVPIPVKVAAAQSDSFNVAFTINGTTIPEKEVRIASEVQGKLVSLFIRNGDMVSAGQVIATLDASVLQVQLVSIDASLAKARLDTERYERLVTLGGATNMQVEASKLNEAALLAQKKEVLEQISHMQIRSPFSGRIENVNVELGSFVSYGTALANLINNSSLKINVYLSEQQAFKLKEGERVQVSSVVLSKTKPATISMISDKADASGKFLAEVTFANSDKDRLKAGMIVDVAFSGGVTESGISIPVSALTGSAAAPKVYVINNHKAVLTSIKTGRITATKVQVLDGLQEGDEVIISGQINLENGSSISIIR